MPPPVAVYVVAAIAGVAAVYAFKELVYEPHIAPALESWAETFLERRRNARNRRASAVNVPSSRRDRRSSSPSPTSPSSRRSPTRHGRIGREGAPAPDDLSAETYELEGLVAREVDEWRNEVLRSQEIGGEGLRKRNRDRPRDEFDSFDGMSMSFDESFTALTRTPLAPTHVVSNVSSPVTVSTISLPLTPTRRLRSESQSTATQDTVFVVPSPLPSPIRESPVTLTMSRTETLSSAEVASWLPSYRDLSSTNTSTPPSPPAPLTIPLTSRQEYSSHSLPFTPSANNTSSPLPFTPTYRAVADDSPFGPLLPDTPRSSAEMYGDRPFSPIARVMGPSSSGSVNGSRATLPSRTNSMNSMRTIGSTRTLRRGSGLINEMVIGSSDDGRDDEEDDQRTSISDLVSTGANESVVLSLSERYPAPPTPPVVVSPPASSIGVISAPSSPRSRGSEVVIDNDVVFAAEAQPRPQPQLLPPLSMLQVPSASRSTSRSRSPVPSATSPALSFASFLSPMSASRTVSESEGDEFMSIADGDSDWSASPVALNGGAGGAYNPFLDFEDVISDDDGSGGDGGGFEHGNENEGNGSEEGSDESWGSARKH
ncbi:hypothetical protein BDN67DRAFT_981912 [Paxillus ammoniavirescens]|nr:hypothetical protein BDN67DRAFT_981912 [Paxillus ammoniavirescens]